jgi:hypothetical protein
LILFCEVPSPDEMAGRFIFLYVRRVSIN